MEPELQALVDEQSPHLRVAADGRVECTLNGHTCPAVLATVRAFVNGKKYKGLLAKREAEQAVSAHAQFLSPSINFEDMVFCSLTNLLVSRRGDAVQKHLGGKRFARAQERFAAGEQELWEEPVFGSEDMEEDGAKGAEAEEESEGGVHVPVGALEEGAGGGAGGGAGSSEADDDSEEEEEEEEEEKAAPRGKGKGKAAQGKAAKAEAPAGGAAEGKRRREAKAPAAGGKKAGGKKARKA